VRKPKNKNAEKQGFRPQYTVSPSPTTFGVRKSDPESLTREISTPAQRDGLEGIINYGEDNALPLRIAHAVEHSPAASSCIDTIAQFIKGSSFSDEELMELVIDSKGTTLWDFHCGLADSLALFWGFAVNFKFDRSGKIVNSFQMSFESCRFQEPGEHSSEIEFIKHNPYYGTELFKREYTKTYPVFNPKEAANQYNSLPPEQKKEWLGQVYYYGKTSPLSRFYPKPRYWSAKEAILADHKLEEFHNEELENGFYQSVIFNCIGDPNAKSKNPKYMKEVVQSDGTTIVLVPDKTVGEEFNDMMSASFSGSNKAGTGMVFWSANADSAIKVEAFPSSVNGDRIIATQDSITKTITIATQVPSILANISEGVSLGSGGSEIQKAIELMQSRTVQWRKILENFYNKVLFPNLQKKPKGKVEIQNYNPVSNPIDMKKYDKVWEFLNEAEKVAFIKKNMPEIEIIRTETPATTAVTTEVEIDPETGEEVPPVQPVKPNEAQKSWGMADINKIQKIVARYNLGLREPGNAKSLTFDQAKQILMSYGLTDVELNAWLVSPEEI
jgi:hypothetical protein